MTIKLAARVQAVKPSATLAVDARAKALKAAGKDVIGLGAGEPDFDTPDHIKAAAIEAIHQGFTKYTAVDGTPSLKAAVVAKFKRENGLDYTPGADPGLLRRQAELLQPGPGGHRPGRRGGDPGPLLGLLPGHGAAGRRRPGAGARGGRAALQDQSRPSCAAALNDKTKLVVINSPSNPTGMAYSADELKAPGRRAARLPARADRHRRHVRAHPLGLPAPSSTSSMSARTWPRAPWCSTASPRPMP